MKKGILSNRVRRAARRLFVGREARPAQTLKPASSGSRFFTNSWSTSARSIARRLAVTTLVLLAALPAARGQSIELTSQDPIQYVDATKEAVALGGARLVYGEYVIDAAEIRYNQETGVASATGGVTLNHGDVRVLAEAGEYSTKDGLLHFRDVRAGSFPFFVTADSAEGTVDDLAFNNATLIYGEPGRINPRVNTKLLNWLPGVRLRSSGAALRIGSIPILAVPSFGQRIGAPLPEVSFKLGYQGRLGPFVNLTALVPVTDDLHVGAGLGIFTRRGVMFGPAADYRHTSDNGGIFSSLRTGYISDGGKRDVDVLGDPISSNRGFVKWHHQQTFGNFSLTGLVNYWSDSEVIRDFTKGEFTRLQQPDTFFEASYLAGDLLFSAFVRPQPNDFQIIQKRLPEVRVDLLPSPVIAGIIHRGSGSAVRLREDAFLTGSDLESDRLDLYYGLSRPWAASPWLTVTPVAGGRLTRYSDPTDGTGNFTRTIGEFGGDVRARAWAEFDYKNETWGIDGLRHLVEPFVQYRAMPSAGNGRGRIPMIDRNVFTTRLQPLGLGDIRSIDDLHDTNTLRLGIDQRLQTRDGDNGSRDLAAIIIAVDHSFLGNPETERQPAMQLDASLMPVRWLRFDTVSRFDIDSGNLEQLNTGVSVIDGRYWSAGLATHFVENELEDYDLRLTRRLNEEFTAAVRLRYDARASSLYEQSYSLRQTLRNLWAIEYELSFNQRARRESNFQFSVKIDFLKF